MIGVDVLSLLRNPITELRAEVAKYRTQQEAAKALGISPQYLTDLLKGRRSFSYKMLQKLDLVVYYVKVVHENDHR